MSLENDLQVAVATPTSFISTPVRGKGGDVVPYGSTNAPDPNTLQRILDPTAPPVPPQDAGAATATASASSAAPSEKAQDDHSVATIIMAQRDRLRARCDALEAERDSFKRELQVQVQTSEGLKTDNSKLYEKVRSGVSPALLVFIVAHRVRYFPPSRCATCNLSMAVGIPTVPAVPSRAVGALGIWTWRHWSRGTRRPWIRSDSSAGRRGRGSSSELFSFRYGFPFFAFVSHCSLIVIFYILSLAK